MLARDHHSLAAVIAGTVPDPGGAAAALADPVAGSTDTAAFGAVALSLRADPLAMAEALVHESHHAVLGAIMDVMPMLAGGQDFLVYAPWRDDPCPASTLLHGVYTHYVMIEFWRRAGRTGRLPSGFAGRWISAAGVRSPRRQRTCSSSRRR